MTKLRFKKFIFIVLGLFSLLWLSACTNNSKVNNISQLLKNSRKNMVFVKGGDFKLGQINSSIQVSEGYGHVLNVSNYYMSRDNISYGEYDVYTGATKRPYLEPELKQYHDFSRAPNYPLQFATWYQAHDYCAWLAKQSGLPYALPTEAQWEYAARNGGNPKWAFPTDDGTQKLDVNFPSDQQLTGQSGNNGGILTPLPVGSIPCTPMGICGMAGDVNEWVNDWYDSDYYNISPVENPTGSNFGTQKIIRGGGPSQSGQNNTLSKGTADPNDPRAGFRCVINSALPPNKLGTFAPGYPK